MEPKSMKIGDTFIFGRTLYTVVAIFEDEDKTFYVAKYAKKYGIYSYSNIFTYDNSGRLYKRV